MNGRRRMMGKGKVAPELDIDEDFSKIKHPDCPEGFDPKKWAKMSLAEKCKYLGIDMQEWIRNQREKIMQRMHKNAKDFRFYAMPEKEEVVLKHPGKKKWHF